MGAINFVDYFYRRVNGATRVSFDANLDRASGEGTYLFANGLPIGMATPGDCQGIKMEFDYGVTPTLTTGKMAHGLDIKMTMDQDWTVDTRKDNCTVRGARIQAVSEDDLDGRLTGAYINACAEGTSTIEGYSSAALHAGPGIIGIQARTETGTNADIECPAAAGILIFHRNKTGGTLSHAYRGLQIEKYMGTLGSIEGTVTGIYIGDDWGGANAFTYGLDVHDDTCTTGIRLGDATTGIDFAGAFSTAGINFNNATLNIDDDDVSLIRLGGYDNGLVNTTVPTDNTFVQSIHLDNRANASKWLAGLYCKITNSTTAQASISQVSVMVRMDIGKSITAAYGVQSHVSFSGSADVSSEVIGLSAMLYGTSGSGTGLYWGVKSDIRTTNAPSGAGHQSACFFAVGTKAISCGLYIEQLVTSMYSGVYIHAAAAITNCIEIGGTTNTTNFIKFNAGGCGCLEDNVKKLGTGDKATAYQLVLDVGGVECYIPVFDSVWDTS